MNQYIFDKLQVLDLHKMDLLAALKRWGQSMIALLVAAVLAVWLIGPKTGAGLFDLAHYLVPAEARALILGTDSAEILTADESAGQLKLWNSAGRDIPSIASQAALIPSHLIDHSAMDRSILRTESERKAVSSHLAKKFQLSPEDTAHYVAQAIAVGKEVNLDPTLIGALILKACIAKAGSLEAGLKNYLGAPNAASGINTYTGKVFSEREELRSIARRFSNNV